MVNKRRTPYELEIILTGKRREHGGDLALLVIWTSLLKQIEKKKWMKEKKGNYPGRIFLPMKTVF